MAEILNRLEEILDYVDFSYKGFLFTEAVVLYETKEYSVPNDIESILTYPLGDNTKVYPLGSLFPLFNLSGKIKLTMKWSISEGKLSVLFLTRELVEIKNSGISTISSEETNVSITLDKPENAYYLIIKKEGLGTCLIKDFALYSVNSTTPKGVSKILLRGVDALKNTFKMWLFSKRGDYGRKINKGGPLDWLLGKPIGTITSTEIYTKLKKEIESQFYNITAKDIQIEEIPESLTYKITIYISDDYNKYIVAVPFILQEG
jgi:hypothetical protein